MIREILLYYSYLIIYDTIVRGASPAAWCSALATSARRLWPPWSTRSSTPSTWRRPCSGTCWWHDARNPTNPLASQAVTQPLAHAQVKNNMVQNILKRIAPRFSVQSLCLKSFWSSPRCTCPATGTSGRWAPPEPRVSAPGCASSRS